ncbi:MAG TPA: cytochrome c biogenesis protein CcsA [Thermoguttaceae bacterium]|nr:cytochrome c biogenesis protein CcsA [Thermoguttaceae bacterium]
MVCRRVVWPVLIALLSAAAVRAEPAHDLDWSAWQHVPVYWQAVRGSKIDGRMMPLDTFARTVVETICGKVNPRLSLAGADEPRREAGSAAPADARELFPDGRKRRFTASELLFSWMVEPERWERVPLLVAWNESLREDVLKLPAKSEDGERLRYASPRQVEQAMTSIHVRLRAVQAAEEEAEAGGEKIAVSAADRKLQDLLGAYNLYRLLTFHPTDDATGRSRFQEKFEASVEAWQAAAMAWSRSQPDLERLGWLDAEQGPGDALESVRQSMLGLAEMTGDRDVPLDRAEPLVVSGRQASDELAAKCGQYKTRLFEAAAPSGWTEAAMKQARIHVHALASSTRDLARQADGMHRALYDNGASLRLVPALNPAALEANRLPSDDAQLWLNLQTMRFGSDEILAGYPQPELEEARKAFADAAGVYVDRGHPQRRERFAAAMDHFASSIRALGVAIEPVRKNLPIQERDEKLIALTAYPPPGSTRAEVHYYRLDPFRWSWAMSLAAVACFALAFGVVRKPMFWTGILVLAVVQLFTAYGLGLRVYITGRAPVTNMFETVVFVGLAVGALALWFTLQPLLWPGLRIAWRVTAAPFTREAGEPGPEPTSPAGRGFWKACGVVLLFPRLALSVLTFLKLAWFPFSPEHARPFLSLLPRTPEGAMMPTGNDLLVWVMGLCLLLFAVWWIPRLLLAALLGVVTIPWSLAKDGVAKPLDEVVARKWFAVSGASVGFLAAYIGYFAPIFDKNINPLMPVLRNNFWLTSHVLSITASYGAGALAWGLGMIALGYYLFGRYRDPSRVAALSAGEGRRPSGGSRGPARAFARRPPAACGTLGDFIYKATQVAVLLLVAGTILGGLWADVSWGRFWSWDRKEVWALISALVYLVVLHGRYAGWSGNFGLAVGSVVGATSILMAWYGVNYVFPGGRHAYGSGSGGLVPVLAIVAANWIFMGFAAFRYVLETRTPVLLPPDEADASPGSSGGRVAQA